MAGKSVRIIVICPSCQVPRPVVVSQSPVAIKRASERTCNRCVKRKGNGVGGRPSTPPTFGLPFSASCGRDIHPAGEGRGGCEDTPKECPSFWDCLTYAANQNWPGWSFSPPTSAVLCIGDEEYEVVS